MHGCGSLGDDALGGASRDGETHESNARDGRHALRDGVLGDGTLGGDAHDGGSRRPREHV